jgi:hypothetical protein
MAPEKPSRETIVNDERAQAREAIRTKLAELDREWTAERWEQAAADHSRRIAEADAA